MKYHFKEEKMTEEYIANELRTIKQKVEAVLMSYPGARDSDKVLIIRYLKAFHRDVLREHGSFSDAVLDESIPSFESITRARRKIQEEGKYRGSRRYERKQEAVAVSDWAVNG
jgi:hypothetical protein